MWTSICTQNIHNNHLAIRHFFSLHQYIFRLTAHTVFILHEFVLLIFSKIHILKPFSLDDTKKWKRLNGFRMAASIRKMPHNSVNEEVGPKRGFSHIEPIGKFHQINYFPSKHQLIVREVLMTCILKQATPHDEKKFYHHSEQIEFVTIQLTLSCFHEMNRFTKWILVWFQNSILQYFVNK